MDQFLVGETDAPIVSHPPVLDRVFRSRIRLATPTAGMPEAWTNAAIDTFADTLSVAAPEGQGYVQVNSVSLPTAVRGRQYYVEPKSGQKFYVSLRAVQAVGLGEYKLQLDDPLPMALEVGTGIRSNAVFHEFSASDVKSAGQGIARWQVDIRVGLDIVQHVWDQPFLVVNAETNYTLNSANLVRMYPIVDRMRPPTDDDLTELIQTGWTNYLRPDLENKGMRANQIKSWERLEACHAAACVYHLILTDERQDPVFRETWHSEYAHQFDLVLGSREFWYSPTDGTAPTRSTYDYRARSMHR